MKKIKEQNINAGIPYGANFMDLFDRLVENIEARVRIGKELEELKELSEGMSGRSTT